MIIPGNPPPCQDINMKFIYIKKCNSNLILGYTDTFRRQQHRKRLSVMEWRRNGRSVNKKIPLGKDEIQGKKTRSFFLPQSVPRGKG
jgi:hypothetical protein